GDHARDLDSEHRRDGLGLAVLAGAVVAAGVSWGHLGTPGGRVLTNFVQGTVGLRAWTLPILLPLLASRLLRHPDKNAHTGRMVVGWTTLIVGSLGLVHIAMGSPTLASGAKAMQSSGGLIGLVISWPLVTLISSWATVPLLALLTGFGVLVI